MMRQVIDFTAFRQSGVWLNGFACLAVYGRLRIMRFWKDHTMRVVQKALTFDDVLLVPAHSKILPREVSLKTRLTRSITLNIPLVSAAMDTVTEARLAIAIAQEGGIGRGARHPQGGQGQRQGQPG